MLGLSILFILSRVLENRTFEKKKYGSESFDKSAHTRKLVILEA